MCRWFAYVSTNEILLEDVLIRPKNAIAQQIVRYWQGFGQYINADGFGISWYTDERSHFNPLAEGVVPLNLANLLTNGGFGIYDGPVLPFVTGPHPAIYKTTIAKPLNDPSFRSLCANVSSKCIFAHLRAADAPPIATTNNHPFVFGRHCFMHNGFIANFKEIRKEMLRHTFEGFAAMVEGGTDTEHLAALYMTYLCTPEFSQGSLADSPDALSLAVRRSDQHTLATAMWTALKSAIKTVEDIQADLRARFPDQYKEPFDNLLNISATDGDSLVALCYRSNTAPGREGVPLWLSVDICDILNRKPYAFQKGRIFEDNRPSDEIYEASKRLFNNAKQAINRDDNGGLVINPDLQRLFEEQSRPTASMHGPHVVVASEPATIDDHWWSLGNKEGILVETVRRKGALLLELYPQGL